MPPTEDVTEGSLGHDSSGQNPVVEPRLIGMTSNGDGHLPLSSQRLIADIINSISEGVVVGDLDGRLVLYNAAAQRMFGPGLVHVVPPEWTGTYGCFREDGVTPFPVDELPLARAIRGESVVDCQILVRTPAQPSGVLVSINSAPLVDGANGVCGGVAVLRDVTSKRSELERVRLLSAVFEQTADTVVITDHTGTIEYVNPATEQITGFSVSELLGRTPRVFRSGAHPRAFFDEMWTTLAAGRAFRGTLINRKKNGEEYHSEQTITPVRDSSGVISHFVSVGRDITDRRRAAEADSRHLLARKVQQRLFPSSAPPTCRCDMAGAVFTADKTGGDYYDFLALPGGGTGVVVGDVSGHAFDAALVMAATRAYLRSISQTTADPGDILTLVNRVLNGDTADNQFVTLILCCLDPVSHVLRYASAGHVTAYVFDRCGEIKAELPSTGLPLGLFPDAAYLTAPPTLLEPGDMVALFTDGVIETDTADGTPFGIERALAVVRQHRLEPAATIVHRVYEAVRDFTGRRPHTDDITTVICKFDQPV